MSRIYTSADQLIGRTPLLELTRIEQEENLPARILAKLECLNPAGSVKDRAAKAMIDDAEARGLLRPGAVIIEPTSGNTGIGLASVAATRGYRVIIVMPETMSIERRQLMGPTARSWCLPRVIRAWQGPLPGRRNWPVRFLEASSLASLTTQPIPLPTGRPPVRKSGRIPAGRWTFSWLA